MHSSIFLLSLLVSIVIAGRIQLDAVARELLEKFPGIESAIAPEISQWSTSTAEASSFLCSIWDGNTPTAIEAALKSSPANSDILSEWAALSTDVSLMSKNSEDPVIGSACSTIFTAVTTTTASPGNTRVATDPTVTLTATVVTVTLSTSQSSLSTSDLTGSSPPLPTGSSVFCEDGQCCSYYKVLAGNTCDGIAASKNISTAQLETWNPKMCGANLGIGAEICVKGPPHGRAPPFGSFPNPTSNGTAVSGSGGSGVLSPTSTSCPSNTCCLFYKVKSGDSCDSIATSKGISLSQIEQWNPNKCGDDLNIGTELCISGPPVKPSSTASVARNTTSSFVPIPTAPCAANQCCQYYEVVPGDSCDWIASKEDIEESNIAQWNPTQCGTDLQIGVHLCINGPSTGAAPPFGTCQSTSCCGFSTVSKGESCYTIATEKGIPESFIIAWNPGMCKKDLQIGAMLCSEGPAAAVGFNATTPTTLASRTSSSPGTSITVSQTTASTLPTVTNSPGRRIEGYRWRVGGLIAFAMWVLL